MSILPPVEPKVQSSYGGNPLSPRETEVVLLVGEALSNQEIADRLGIAVKTAKNHVAAAIRALGASNRFDAYLKLKALTEEQEEAQSA